MVSNNNMDTITTESFAQHVEGLLSRWRVPGLNIAVLNSETTVTRSFGLASLEPRVPTTSDTIFDCASTSKSLTAAAVAKLVAADKFKWTTPVSSLLPDAFVLPDVRLTAEVTVEDILSHRTGMASHDLSYMGLDATSPDGPRSVTENLRNLAIHSPLRTEFLYCNMLYTAAAYLVEQVSGQSFAQFLQEQFFTPLKMASTFVQHSAVRAAGADFEQHMAQAYRWHEKDQKFVLIPRRDQPEGTGAGLLQSTVTDYAQWVRAMMTKSPLLFPAEIYDELITPRIIDSPDEVDDALAPFTSISMYAMGWNVEFYRGTRLVKHDGSDSGFQSAMLFIPQKQFGLVIHTNSLPGWDVAQIIACELVDEVLCVPSVERIDWEKHRLRREAEYQERRAKKVAKMRMEFTSAPKGGEETKDVESLPKDAAALKISLAAHTGTYTNTGYHSVQVAEKDGALFIDARDRGMPFTLTFEHVHGGSPFFVHMEDSEGTVSFVKAQFKMGADGIPSQLGLDLCGELDPDLIWFSRNSDGDSLGAQK